ncbi:S41 family peptidase [Erythrobacter donghaensis]|jgi:hypothetical protein|uniref:S41 family peptidase n=1 Tax=Erythrobacter donghaensis TaxID=267135 RepID=UPI00093E53AD|nr:S41 family peptidase [Erythrobacter donghaensis]
MILSRRHFMAGGAAAIAATGLPTVLYAAETGRLRPSQMRADLDLLQRAYETVHPGLLRYLPPGGFAERIVAAKDWARRERSLGEFYIALARITASIRCGHTHPNPFNQSDAASAALFGGRNRLPFAFRWIDGEMIVTGGRAGTSTLAPGSRITMIDGTPARDLLAAMLPLARADGGNDAKRVAQLGIGASDRYAAFDVFRPLLKPARKDGTVRLGLIDPQGRTRLLEAGALTEAEIRAARAPDDAPLDWPFAIRPDRIGVLTMGDWATYRSKWDWKAYLDGVLDRLIDEGAKGLIIDLRGNEGGTECGWHLLERLVAADLPLPQFRRRLRYRALPSELNPFLDTWDRRFRDWGEAAQGPDAEGFYERVQAAPDEAAISPRGRRFGGPVAVLVNAACSSATFQFANALSGSGVATIIGEPTGGNRRGINGDAYFFVRLPETGLEVDLPIVGIFSARPEPDAGIIPDRLVRVTAEDLALGRDRQFAGALAVVGGNPPQ